MKVVVGLGNPGSRYQGTRHNVGFDVIDSLAAGPHAGRFQSRFQAQVAELHEDGEKVLLVKPETFMNLSGRCVRQVLDFFQAPTADLLVVCDDINLPLGKLRIRARGTHGGHNGLRDIQNHLGGVEYAAAAHRRGRAARRRDRPRAGPLPAGGAGGDRGRRGPGGAGRDRLGPPGRRGGHEQVQCGNQGQGRKEPQLNG